MHFSKYCLALSLLQAVSAFYTSSDTLDLSPRSIDDVLEIRDLIDELDFVEALVTRAPGRDSPPRVDLSSKKHPETIKNKLAANLPDKVHLLPAGQQDRSDMGGKHGVKGKTVMDHAIPSGTKEGQAASRAGKNRLAEVPAREQNSEGGLEAAARKKAEKQKTNTVLRTVDGKPMSEVKASSNKRKASDDGPASNTRSKKPKTRRSLQYAREVFARNAAADAYAEALAAHDEAVEMYLQGRDLFWV